MLHDICHIWYVSKSYLPLFKSETAWLSQWKSVNYYDLYVVCWMVVTKTFVEHNKYFPSSVSTAFYITNKYIFTFHANFWPLWFFIHSFRNIKWIFHHKICVLVHFGSYTISYMENFPRGNLVIEHTELKINDIIWDLLNDLSTA